MIWTEITGKPTGDVGNSPTGGNFYQNWFESKESPGGTVMYGEHNTQHITANRKGYAMRWILARIAGGDGISCSTDNCPDDPNKLEPSVCCCGVPDIDATGDGTIDCNDGMKEFLDADTANSNPCTITVKRRTQN